MGLFEIFSAALTGFYALIPSYGLAIILLTLSVRTILLPLSIKQTRSMREMQKIQPEVKKLQAKYKGDRQKLNEEMMALYKEHGVNPFGGCLPMILQLPVMIGLFYVIQTPLKYMGFMPPKEGPVTPARFLPADGLSGIMETLQNSRLAEQLHDHALSVNRFLGIRLDCKAAAAMNGQDPLGVGQACGDGIISALPYLFLILVMGLTTFYQQKQMQAASQASGAQAQQQQLMAKILPIMLVVFAFNFPSGVVLYWITTNLWTIGQQAMMLRLAPPVAAGAATAASGPGKMSKAALKQSPASKPSQPKKSPARPESDSKTSSKRSPSAKKKKR